VLEFVEVRKEFFVAQLYNLPAQPLTREESKIRSKKIRRSPLERCRVRSLVCLEWEKLRLNQRPGHPIALGKDLSTLTDGPSRPLSPLSPGSRRKERPRASSPGISGDTFRTNGRSASTRPLQLPLGSLDGPLRRKRDRHCHTCETRISSPIF
jgi:hypothetical protein